MNGLTLITCSYNTPEITMMMLRSFRACHKGAQQIIVVDNSTNDKTTKLLEAEGIKCYHNPDGTHGDGVNIALAKCKTKYALLVDTDIVFLQDHSSIFEQFKDSGIALLGKIEGDRGGKKIYNRVNPWHCFIDVQQIKQHNILFFDEQRMRDSFKTDKIYDIGSTFFEDIHTKGLKIGNIDIQNRYYFHFEGMSWYSGKFDPDKEDTGIDFGGTHNNPAFNKLHAKKIIEVIPFITKYAKVDIKDTFLSREPILLIKFPTRNRTKKFFDTLTKYYQKLSYHTDTRFLITCDIDDDTMNNDAVKKHLAKFTNLTVEYLNNKTKIEAINNGLEGKDFDIILLASDDMIPQVKGFDEIIINQMCNNFADLDGVAWFNDGTQGQNLNTLCILGKKYYDRFGYIYHPAYKSLWCDMEFTQVSVQLNKYVYSDQVIIKHKHHSVTNSGMDALYDVNEKYEAEDKKTFFERQAKGFHHDT